MVKKHAKLLEKRFAKKGPALLLAFLLANFKKDETPRSTTTANGSVSQPIGQRTRQEDNHLEAVNVEHPAGDGMMIQDA